MDRMTRSTEKGLSQSEERCTLMEGESRVVEGGE